MKKKKELKNIQLCVRITEDSLKLLKKMAKTNKVTLSKFVRSMVEAYVKK